MKRLVSCFAAAVFLLASCVIPLEDEMSHVGLTSAPPPPAGLAAAILSPSSVRLSWEAALGADSYKVWRSTEAAVEFTEVAAVPAVPAAAYTDAAVSSGKDFYYRISAVGEYGESAQSKSVRVSFEPPAAPTGLAAVPESRTSALVTWEAAEGASSYTLYCATDSGAFTKLASVQTTSYRHANLNGDFKYSYKVAAANIVGESAPSAAVEVVFMVPAAPTGLAATALSDTSIEVTWDTVPGAVMYKVYRSYTSSLETSVSTNSFVDTGLKPFDRYDYTVSAVNNIGEGPKVGSKVSRYTQPVPLQDGVWHTISESYGNLYYSFPVSGGSYFIQWGNAGHTAEVTTYHTVSAYWVGINSMETLTTPLFSNKTEGLANPQKVTPASSGYVVVKIYGNHSGDIRYYKE